MNTDAVTLLALIERAFDGVPRGQITLHEADLLDRYEFTVAEQEAARSKDQESRWQDVPDEAIVDNADAMPFLDPASWRYYLPAFMSWSIRHIDEKDADPVDATIYTVAHTDTSYLDRYRTLSDDQVSAVARFLRFMMIHPVIAHSTVAAEALEFYWLEAEAATRHG